MPPGAGFQKGKFESSHIYSAAPEAAKKEAIDVEIMGGDYASPSKIDMKSEEYLKALIDLASKGKKPVKTNARGLQFFIVKGGAEGFLDASYRDRDASRIVRGEVTTDGKPGTTMIFDDNDLIAVFDAKGKLVSSALLRRPISIATPKKPLFWTEATADKVYDAWDGQPVSIYRNTNPQWDIKYYGLWINDKLHYYENGWVRIDLHKKEATNGCIFIMDPNTPPYAETERLSAFEPQFILDVQKQIGAKTKWGIGTMHMVKVQ
jgi:hypothetical protein